MPRSGFRLPSPAFALVTVATEVPPMGCGPDFEPSLDGDDGRTWDDDWDDWGDDEDGATDGAGSAGWYRHPEVPTEYGRWRRRRVA